MALDDMYQLTLKGYYQTGNPMMNVFHYMQIYHEGTGPEICQMFVDQPLVAIRALYYSETKFDVLELRGLFQTGDDYDMPLSLTGSRPGIADQLPQHDAMGMRFRHANPNIRSGYKRWWNPTENDNAEGIVVAGTLVFLNDIGNALLTPLKFGVGGAINCLEYVIVKRILVSPGVYRLPATLAEAAWGQVADFDVAPVITTQNSRKVYAA